MKLPLMAFIMEKLPADFCYALYSLIPRQDVR